MFSNFFFESRIICMIMWKNIVERSRPHMTTWCMHIACCIPRATNIHSKCVILTAFPRQQWLHETASMLCCTYIVLCFGWMGRRIGHINGLTEVGTWSRVVLCIDTKLHGVTSECTLLMFITIVTTDAIHNHYPAFATSRTE